MFTQFDIANLQLKRGTLDFEVSLNLSKVSGITQQLYLRGGQKYTFLERYLNFYSEHVNFMSVGSMGLILLALMSHSCGDTPVFT